MFTSGDKRRPQLWGNTVSVPTIPSRCASACKARRWIECLGLPGPTFSPPPGEPLVIGVLPGEGIGPEVVAAALGVLTAVTSRSGIPLKICDGSRHSDSPLCSDTTLPEDLIEFCQSVFDSRGAILSGAISGRFVYDLRKRFDLFLKISPLRIANGVTDTSCLKREAVRDLDILLTREGSGGVYQGGWEEDACPSRGRSVRHHFTYTEAQVGRFLHASAWLAKQRRGELTVVWKESGLPSISKLWLDCAEDAAAAHGVRLRMVDIDLMAYRLVKEACEFDVIAAPNLFGDVLADLGAILIGSRGISYSGNYSGTGGAVYQTNHGAARDLAGTDHANPVGQILSLAMMLRESFALDREASSIEAAIQWAWKEGWRTQDVAVPGSRVVGTSEMGARVAEQAVAILETRLPAAAAE